MNILDNYLKLIKKRNEKTEEKEDEESFFCFQIRIYTLAECLARSDGPEALYLINVNYLRMSLNKKGKLIN